VTARDPDLQENRKLEAIEARMARYEKTAQRTLILVIPLAVLALALSIGHIFGLIP
jgi:hypothetical protein